MWDPVSIFAIMWMLNKDLPGGRLNVESAIETHETNVVVQSISEQIKLRNGL